MSKSKTPQVEKTERKKTTVKVVLIAILIVIMLLGGLAFGAYSLFNHYFLMLNRDSSDDSTIVASSIPEDDDIDLSLENASPEEIKAYEDQILKNWESNKDKVVFSGDVYNMLLIGLDAHDSENPGRSDTMVVVSVNKETKQITLTSLMRDSYVYIPKVGFNRLNAAIVYGGPARLFDTIEQNFSIHIDNYVKTDFASFVDAIDLVGGVDIEVTPEEIKEINNGAKASDGSDGETPTVELVAGSEKSLQHLNGKQALAYSRIRYVGNADFERTERQRKVLLQLVEKVKGLSISELNTLAKELFPLFSTNLTQSETLSLLWSYFTAYKDYDVQTFRIPEDGTYEFLMIDGMSVLGIDYEKNIEDYSQKVYGTSTTEG
ncbi:MAG: LytR family transcriptional regulator [Clostridia bacterium]|nr:LytR family transcriptional regulator [Clostridia bacterium]